MRYRLLQARNPGDPVAREEHEAFASRLLVSPDDVEPWGLVERSIDVDQATDGVDAVLVGGSGHYSVLDNEAWLRAFIDTLGAVADRGFPMFASCFGFQGLVLALGGEVVKDDDRAEVGTFEVELTESGVSDPLFGGSPPTFFAQQGHKDHAVRLPSGTVHLARSARSEFQALRVVGTPVVATQFHAELVERDNRMRLERYLREYRDALGEDEVERILQQFHPSPDTEPLLRRFAAEIESNTP